MYFNHFSKFFNSDVEEIETLSSGIFTKDYVINHILIKFLDSINDEKFVNVVSELNCILEDYDYNDIEVYVMEDCPVETFELLVNCKEIQVQQFLYDTLNNFKEDKNLF